jgi:hypothetical protein
VQNPHWGDRLWEALTPGRVTKALWRVNAADPTSLVDDGDGQ